MQPLAKARYSRDMITVDASKLQQGSRGKITGQLHATIDGEPFPEAQWNDFPVVVLTWWLDAISQLLKEEVRSADLRFMDGPFLLRVSHQRRGLFRVEAIRGAKILRTTDVIARAFANSIINAGLSVRQACADQGWSSDDLTALGEQLSCVSNLGS